MPPWKVEDGKKLCWFPGNFYNYTHPSIYTVLLTCIIVLLLDTTKPELRDLIDLLVPLAPQYHAIGVRLSVPMRELGLVDLPLPQLYQKNLITTLEWWIKKW